MHLGLRKAFLNGLVDTDDDNANSLENQEFQSIACLVVVSFPEFDLKVAASYLHSLLVKGATAIKEKLCS